MNRFLLLFLYLVCIIIPAQATDDLQLSEIVEQQRRAILDNRHDDAVSYGRLALDRYKSGEIDTLIVKALDFGGNSAIITRQYIQALEFYIAAVQLGEQQGYEKSVALGLNDIGNIYETFGDYERARDYFERSYAVSRKGNYHYLLASSLLNLVNINSLLGEVEQAKRYHSMLLGESLRTNAETMYWQTLARSSIAQAEGDYSKAIQLCRKAAEVAKSNGLSDDLSILAGDRIGKAYLGLEMMDSVYAICNSIIQTPDALELYPDILANSYSRLADVYATRGETDSVLKYRFLAVQINDSIFNRREFNAACDRLYKYENEKVRDEMFELNGRIGAQSRWIISITVALIVAIAFLLLIYHNNRRLTKANKMLLSKNSELERQEAVSRQLRERLAEMYESESQVTPEPEPALDDKSQESEKPASKQPLLSERQTVVLLRDIERVMKNEALITKPNFSIVELAQLVKSNTTYVSAAINSTYGKNFKTYLNEHRIRIAAAQLLKNGNLTISAIAESVGFKSSGNFVTAFKRVMGVNPSVYRRLEGMKNEE